MIKRPPNLLDFEKLKEEKIFFFMSDNKENPGVPALIPVVAGAFSGVFTRLVCQPLDVIKIRFQLQVEPIKRNSSQSKYHSIPQAFSVIIREEGVKALWKGHMPAQALSITYGVFQFGVYEAMLHQAKNIPMIANDKVKVEFVCGFTGGCLATIISFPFDIVRTRLIAQSSDKGYSSTMSGLVHILQTEGIQGWWKGLMPTLLQIGPLTGVQFAVYNICKRLIQEVSWLSSEGGGKSEDKLALSGAMVAGSVSGFTAKVTTYPLDLIRKRMQLQGFQDQRVGFGKNFKCSSLLSCVTETVREERLQGLFKGLTPSLLKATLVSALIFTSYELSYQFLCDIYKVSK